jgi:cell division protein FtsQ
MARGSFQGIPLRARKLGAPRRRYDVALNVPGAEVRLPSMPVIQPGWRLASGMLILLVAACLFTLWYSPAFRVDSIEVSGLQRLSLADLTTVIRVLDEPVFLVDPGQVTQALQQAFPEISSLEVHVGLPADVSIKLTERQPLISWIQDGQELWVDAEGVSFSPRGDPGQLVRVQANDPPPAQSTANDSSSIETQATTVSLPTQPALHVPAELVSTIVYLGGQIPAEIMLVYDREHGLGWSDPRGWDVYFGSNLQDLEMKLVMYQTLVDTLQAEGIQPALISLEFLHAPYYRMER